MAVFAISCGVADHFLIFVDQAGFSADLSSM
jgi:hypothetical protein